MEDFDEDVDVEGVYIQPPDEFWTSNSIAATQLYRNYPWKPDEKVSCYNRLNDEKTTEWVVWFFYW